MSKSTPATALGVAFAVAVTTALAQLGLMSGLAILLWRDGSADEWAAHLSWGAWLAATATIAGSLAAGRLTTDIGARVTAVLAAGVGGFAIAPLTALPAMRFDDSTIATAPFAAVGIGVVAGMVIAGLGLASRAITINVLAAIAVTWVLALLAAFVPAGSAADIVQAGVWSEWTGMSTPLEPALTAGSLLIGMATAWVMTTQTAKGDHRITAISGATGPLLLVAVYAAAGQADVNVDPQWHGMGIAGAAAVAGLLGTLLVTALRRGPAPAPTQPAHATQPVTATAAVEPASLGDPIADHYTQPMPAATSTEPAYVAEPDPYVTADYNAEALSSYQPPSQNQGRADTRGTEFDVDEESVPEPKPEPKAKPKRAKKAAKKPKKTEPAPQPVADDEQAQFQQASDAAAPTQSGPVDADDDWFSELRDDNALINDQNEHPETDNPETPAEKKRRWSRKKKE